LIWGAAAAALLLLLAHLTAGRLPAFVPIGLVLGAGAALSLGGAGHLSGDRRLAWIIGGSYLVRSALAIVLYVVSAAQLPVLPSLQRGNGFWAFALDAEAYHAAALQLRAAGTFTGSPLLHTATNLFCGTIAALYAAFVPHPLIPILVGAWAATATALLAFVIVREVGGSASRRLTAAALVAFWPSSLVWTSQLLREGLFFVLLFLAYAVIAWLLARPRGWVATPIGLIVLGSSLVLVSVSRFYAGWALLAGILAATLVSLTGPFAHARRMVTACAGVVALAVWIGTTQPSLWPRDIAAVLSRPAAARVLVLLAGLAGVAAALHLARRRGLAALKLGSLALVLVVALGVGAWLVLPRDFRGNPYQPGVGLRAAPGLWALPSFEMLETFRQEFVVRGGTLTDLASTPIATPAAFVGKLPAAAATSLLAPFPWRWAPRGETGIFRTLAGSEILLIACLLPGIVVGAARLLRRRSVTGWLMVTSAAVALIALALGVATEGTLFRYRLLGLLPLLVIASAGGGFEIYARAWPRLARRRSQGP
jgi:hypothetical protein